MTEEVYLPHQNPTGQWYESARNNEFGLMYDDMHLTLQREEGLSRKLIQD